MCRTGGQAQSGCVELNTAFVSVEKKNQLDATECLITLIISSTSFGHLFAHHQELEIILVLLPHMLCNALVAGGRLHLTADHQQPRHYTAYAVTTQAPDDGHISARNVLSRL